MKRLTEDIRWDCNECVNRWVFILCIEMNMPSVSRGHKCWLVLRAQSCFDPALYVRPAICHQSVEGPGHKCWLVLRAQSCFDPALYVRPAIYHQSVEGPGHKCWLVLRAQSCFDPALVITMYLLIKIHILLLKEFALYFSLLTYTLRCSLLCLSEKYFICLHVKYTSG